MSRQRALGGEGEHPRAVQANADRALKLGRSGPGRVVGPPDELATAGGLLRGSGAFWGRFLFRGLRGLCFSFDGKCNAFLSGRRGGGRRGGRPPVEKELAPFQVLLKVVFPGELLRANLVWATERLGVCMRHHVPLQVVLPDEGLAAEVTAVRLKTRLLVTGRRHRVVVAVRPNFRESCCGPSWCGLGLGLLGHLRKGEWRRRACLDRYK